MKVIVTGSRDWFSDHHIELIHRELVAYPTNTIIVHGACEGVDTIAGLIAKDLGFIVKEYPANWHLYPSERRAWAGPIRNKHMIITENRIEEPVDLIAGFHDDIEKSKGTKNMRKLSYEFNIPWRLIAG